MKISKSDCAQVSKLSAVKGPHVIPATRRSSSRPSTAACILISALAFSHSPAAAQLQPLLSRVSNALSRHLLNTPLPYYSDPYSPHRNDVADTPADGSYGTYGPSEYGGIDPPAMAPEPVEAPPVDPPSAPPPPVPAPDPADVPAPMPAPPPAPPAAGPEDGEVRLVARVDVNGFATGALQLAHDGAYGAVCAKAFDRADAVVACRQLGFSGGVPIRPLPLDDTAEDISDLTLEVLAPFVIENLGCVGDEASLLDCPVAAVADGQRGPERFLYDDLGPDGCAPYRASRTDSLASSFAFVACSLGGTGAEEGELRLADGGASDDGRAAFGRLEVFLNGGWGTFCNLRDPLGFREDAVPFTQEAVTVACRQLGFADGARIQSQAEVEAAQPANIERIPIAVAGADCTGTEASLLGCPRGLPDRQVGPRRGPCGHDDDVYLACSSGTSRDDGTLRLEGGELAEEFAYGRLEVLQQRLWSDVCGTEKFTPASARVACRQLGYDGGAALQFPRPYEFGRFVPPNLPLEAYLPVALAAVDCGGSEKRLIDCPSDAAAVPRCTNGTDSTVLACGNTDTGCGIEIEEAEGAVRLRGGFGSPCDPLYSGIVEIFHDGEWGAICGGRVDPEDNPFGTLAPDVICRQLGYPHGTVVDALNPAAPDDFSGDNTEESALPFGRVWLNDLLCRGPEAQALDCELVPPRFLSRRDDGSSGECRSGRRLYVACREFPVLPALEAVVTPGAEEGDVRLLDQEAVDNWITGELQVFFEGSWSQVCETNFNAASAAVACRQLGYTGGSVAADFAVFAQPFDTDDVDAEVAVTTPGCEGGEATLLECPGMGGLRRTASRGCQSVRSLPLRLACVRKEEEGPVSHMRAGVEGELRLRTLDGTAVQPPGADSGIPEIFHAGAWGTFCRSGRFRRPGEYEDYGFPFQPDPDNAVVLCRELGFEDGFLYSIEAQTLPDNVSLAPPWLGGFRCDGTEATVLDCQLPGFGETDTCGKPQRLFCSPVDAEEGTARLVDGAADDGGVWEYGRLEFVFDGFWTTLSENDDEALGRRGAAVACRSLGYAAGAQFSASNAAPLPGDGVDARSAVAVACRGDEESLAGCVGTGTRRGAFEDASIAGGLFDVTVMCTNPTGCKEAARAPREGDVRLVPVVRGQPATAACDPVHFGAVEFFRGGQWGRICTTDEVFRNEAADLFVLDAQVVCRQLGFRFGGIYDVGEDRRTDFVSGDYTDSLYTDDYEPGVAFATEVTCTGKEERLDECFFPEGFGDDTPGAGVDTSCTTQQRRRFGVLCRQFEITESILIR